MPEFSTDVAAREAKKAAELTLYIETALARKTYMEPLEEEEVPVVLASVEAATIDAQARRNKRTA